ncbi:hypothetical protein [Shewanella aestuarii]|uniref:Uncharacterized protein n=1 Tax=Shewanella aestuarii TaxID=1028752 RepID=A0A6G9QP67_9GAMM|nr:hypothetical protein [Shewanella aestuarii]QIR16390.1 hypothetical protein HBH39_18100 [Shewanella aestuarii]
MTPLSEMQREAISQGNFALKFAVHKYNSYMPGHILSIEEAAKCVVLQSKWAVSHDINGFENVKVNLLSHEIVTGLGIFITIIISEVENKPYQQSFIVTESESHWFLFDHTLSTLTKPKDVINGKPIIAKYQSV